MNTTGTWFVVDYYNNTEHREGKILVFSTTEENAKDEAFETGECGFGNIQLYAEVYEGNTDGLDKNCYYRYDDVCKSMNE